jgi:flagellar FliJ protein
MAVFPLAGLLRLRRLKEDLAAAEVGNARSRASRLAAQRHQLIVTLPEADPEKRDVSAVAALAASRAAAATMLGDLEALRVEHDRAVAVAEGEHRRARQETAAVEKLEERHGERQRALDLRAEQHVLDELAGRAAAAGEDER